MNTNTNLDKLQEILAEAQKSGLDVSELKKQVEKAISNAKEDKIRIVLMGAFSDGKTTAIAGVLGKELPNMKIDIAESSDELTHYEVNSLGKDFEIVDTPGLFGTKEREYEGSNVRYSDITRKYLSQAHVILYVTNAVNPIKDSHSQILHWVLRDLGKLNNTIFVINKMDEAGYDLSDDVDFARGEKIKKENLISRLDNIIKLKDSEKKALNVICIAANPNGRGLKNFWFTKPDIYKKRSRIDILRQCIDTVAKGLDKQSANKNVSDSTIKDVVRNYLAINYNFKQSKKAPLEEFKDRKKEAERKLTILTTDVQARKGELDDELADKKAVIIEEIKSASQKSFESVIDKYIGSDGGRLYEIINDIFTKYSEQNKSAYIRSNIESDFEQLNELTQSTLKWGSNVLKNAKVSSDTVKTIRNIIAPSFKFKPWGAVKAAKWFGRITTVIGVAIEVFTWWQRHKKEKEFQKAKGDLTKSVKDAFKEASALINPDENYFNALAPGIIEGRKYLEELTNSMKKIEKELEQADSLYYKLRNWYGADIEDVEYTEIKY
jgi:predicted GTPase